VLRVAALFFGDDKRTVEGALRALKFSNADIAWVVRLSEGRHKLGAAVDAAMLRDGPVPDAELRRWAATVGRTASAQWWRLNAALWSARRAAGHAAPRESKVASTYRRLLRIAWRDAIEVGDLKVDGEDLQKIVSGPAIGVMLKELLERVIEEPGLNTREKLLQLADGLRHTA
jgi:tRNA nucleotidyltransferase (CCA-adding enzyme)